MCKSTLLQLKQTIQLHEAKTKREMQKLIIKLRKELAQTKEELQIMLNRSAEEIQEEVTRQIAEALKQHIASPQVTSHLHPSPPLYHIKTPFDKLHKETDFKKWKHSCPIHAAAHPQFLHLTTTTIEGYYMFKPTMSQDEKTLLYSITTAAIDSKILYRS
jgi:hypothetical protein